MRMLQSSRAAHFLIVASVCLFVTGSGAQESKTVIGPSNPDLRDGAQALMVGNAEKGVRLTLRGLKQASNYHEKTTAMANLCAGYVMLNELETALSYCDRVLRRNDRHWRAYNNRALAYILLKRYDEAEADLQKAEALAANSKTVKNVRAMLLDATDPVAPNIVIDDQRQPPDADAG